jgi:hypothetical protein
MDQIERNQIKVTHNGQQISLIQHWADGQVVMQEVANVDNFDQIYGFGNSLDSLIKSLELLRSAINTESE